LVQSRTIEGDEHEARFSARHEQRRVVETKPRSVVPASDVNERQGFSKRPARRHEPVGRVLVSQQPG
jgi:hypothetical protein